MHPNCIQTSDIICRVCSRAQVGRADGVTALKQVGVLKEVWPVEKKYFNLILGQSHQTFEVFFQIFLVVFPLVKSDFIKDKNKSCFLVSPVF